VLCFISRSVCAGKACKERRESGFGLVCYRTSDKATSPESAFLGSGSRPFFPLPFLNQQPASAVPAIISHHPPSTIHHPQQQLIANLKSKSTQCIQQIRDPDREPTLCPAVSCFVLFAGWLFVLLAVDTGALLSFVQQLNKGLFCWSASISASAGLWILSLSAGRS